MQPETMRRLVTHARVGRLATADADGRPHVVPFCYALDGDRLYSAVDQKPKTTTRLKRLDNIRANPRVEVVVDHYEDDWANVWWVRVRGMAAVREDGAERDRAVACLCEKYTQYRDDPPAGPVVSIKIVRWSGWSASPLDRGER